MALDLHYLLSFHGDEAKLEPQRLLGSVARTLHAHPVLTREMIQDTLQDPLFGFLAGSDLADQVEPVKFTPSFLSLEELSKLWSVFLRPIRPVGRLPGLCGPDRGPGRAAGRRCRSASERLRRAVPPADHRADHVQQARADEPILAG